MRYTVLTLLALATAAMADNRAKEVSYLTPIMPAALAQYGNLQVPAIENLDIITENGEHFLELRMLRGQEKTLNG